MKVTNQFRNWLKLVLVSLLCAQSLLLSANSMPLSNELKPEQAPPQVSFISPLDFSTIVTPSLVQGGYLIGKISKLSNPKVTFNDKPVTVDKQGYFIVGVGRDQTDAKLKVQADSQIVYQHQLPVETREYDIQRIDGLEPSKVNPIGEQVLKRIRAEAGEVYLARQAFDERKDFLKGFIWPAKGPISGVYGSQRVLNGEPKRPHFGVDIAGPVGTDIIAPADGIVRLAHKDMYYSGGTMIIDHGHGLSSTFLHLSDILVTVGQTVSQGQLVAKMGATGRATGSHLDWRLNWFNVRLDPQLVVTGSPE